jgi:methyl-accepting chemotaxis protein
MHPRLEELRKRLMEPVPNGSSGPSGYIPLRRGSNVFVPATNRSQQLPNSDLEPDHTEIVFAARNSTRITPLMEQPAAIEETQAKAEDQVALKTPQSLDGFARAVAELFEPARQCQRHLTEIKAASESMDRLTRDLCDPLKSFHGHISRLSSSFESMRTFRDELGALAESFPPVRALHQEIAHLAQTMRTHLVEVANGLEPAKALGAEIRDLAAAIDSVSDLQAQFYELSKAFGDPIEPN